MARTVYRLGITKSAATLAEHGQGISTGHIRWENGKAYILVKATAVAIADGALLMSELGQATLASTVDVTVKVTTGATVEALCANNTGAIIPASFYFWGIQQGRGYCISAGILDTDGLGVMPAAAGGVAVLTGATVAHCGVFISDLTATVLSNAVLWSLPGKHAQA